MRSQYKDNDLNYECKTLNFLHSGVELLGKKFKILSSAQMFHTSTETKEQTFRHPPAKCLGNLGSPIHPNVYVFEPRGSTESTLTKKGPLGVEPTHNQTALLRSINVNLCTCRHSRAPALIYMTICSCHQNPIRQVNPTFLKKRTAGPLLLIWFPLTLNLIISCPVALCNPLYQFTSSFVLPFWHFASFLNIRGA